MLDGKFALITGASRGIGRQTAKLLAENGAKIAINYNTSEDAAISLLEEIGGRGFIVKADIRNADDVKAMFTKVKEEFGTLDILVNNAGVLHDSLMLMTKEEDYDNIMDTNLKGTYLCTQFASKIMMKKKSGKIINISSIVGVHGNLGQVAYSASKAGVIGLTKSAAKELGGSGIQVNAIAPGLIDTDMISSLKDDVKEKLIKSTALKRIGTPEDVAKVILFLASDMSDYVSGQVIGVDGCQIM